MSLNKDSMKHQSLIRQTLLVLTQDLGSRDVLTLRLA